MNGDRALLLAGSFAFGGRAVGMRLFGRWAMSLACAAAILPRAWGDALTWNNAAGGAWSTPANWTPVGGPPTAGDTATFNLNNTHSVQTGTLSPSSADAMTVTAGSVTLESSSMLL